MRVSDDLHGTGRHNSPIDPDASDAEVQHIRQRAPDRATPQATEGKDLFATRQLYRHPAIASRRTNPATPAPFWAARQPGQCRGRQTDLRRAGSALGFRHRRQLLLAAVISHKYLAMNCNRCRTWFRRACGLNGADGLVGGRLPDSSVPAASPHSHWIRCGLERSDRIPSGPEQQSKFQQPPDFGQQPHLGLALPSAAFWRQFSRDYIQRRPRFDPLSIADNGNDLLVDPVQRRRPGRLCTWWSRNLRPVERGADDRRNHALTTALRLRAFARRQQGILAPEVAPARTGPVRPMAGYWIMATR